MLSLSLQSDLEREVVGQPRAVHTVTRAVSIACSGLANPESPVGIYLFVGPSGTGKTHLARSLARRLHGSTGQLAVADCMQISGRQEWATFVRQIAPHFRVPVPGSQGQLVAMAPLSILLVERLESARPEFVHGLVSALECGNLALPDGRCGTLRGALVLLTSSLCAREINEAGRQEIGFTRATDLEESERARIYQQCFSAAEKLWGPDLLCHVEDLVVFHRLRAPHMPLILERLVGELNRRLASAGISCEVDGEASQFLLGRASRFLKHGAWVLVKAFRRFVVFPVADMVNSRAIPRGHRVLVGRESADRLRFTVRAARGTERQAPPGGLTPVLIAVDWNESSPALHSAAPPADEDRSPVSAGRLVLRNFNYLTAYTDRVFDPRGREEPSGIRLTCPPVPGT